MPQHISNEVWDSLTKYVGKNPPGSRTPIPGDHPKVGDWILAKILEAKVQGHTFDQNTWIQIRKEDLLPSPLDPTLPNTLGVNATYTASASSSAYFRKSLGIIECPNCHTKVTPDMLGLCPECTWVLKGGT